MSIPVPFTIFILSSIVPIGVGDDVHLDNVNDDDGDDFRWYAS
jgi:hypothetical protein